jgi:hypothetical protein
MLVLIPRRQVARRRQSGGQRREEDPMDTRGTRRFAVTLALAGTVMLGVAGSGPGAAVGTAADAAHITSVSHAAASTLAAAANEDAAARVAFREEMRRLWEDHIVWTRLYIVSAAADLPDMELTAQRLLRNQADIGAAVAPFYGDEAAAALTGLLEEHITGAGALLAAAKAGDESAVETATASWYANADAIAAFLHAANPDHWPEAALRAEMRMHLDLTLAEATARLGGDYAADIAAYDEVHDHILRMADLLSGGIVAQFPDRFAP